MSNVTNVLTDLNYNLSTTMSDAIIEEPTHWLINWNALLGYFPVVIGLALFGIAIWVIMRNTGAVGDAEALSYAGVMSTFAGIMLFVVASYNDVKLLTWVQFLPFIVLTAIFIFVYKANQNY